MLTSVLATPVVVVTREEKEREEEKRGRPRGPSSLPPFRHPLFLSSNRLLGLGRPSPRKQHPRLVNSRVALLCLCGIFFWKQSVIDYETLTD